MRLRRVVVTISERLGNATTVLLHWGCVEVSPARLRPHRSPLCGAQLGAYLSTGRNLVGHIPRQSYTWFDSLLVFLVGNEN